MPAHAEKKSKVEKREEKSSPLVYDSSSVSVLVSLVSSSSSSVPLSSSSESCTGLLFTEPPLSALIWPAMESTITLLAKKKKIQDRSALERK